jgi:hypothetical protein
MFSYIATPPVLRCAKYDLRMRVYCSANPNVSFTPERGLHRKGEKGVYIIKWQKLNAFMNDIVYIDHMKIADVPASPS